MMYNVRLLILFLGIACAVFLIIGLFKPWAMLWWEDVQNRRKVIVVYGTLMMIFFIAYYSLKFFEQTHL
jgi:hypothetical protein